jgi:hypothetical protein
MTPGRAALFSGEGEGPRQKWVPACAGMVRKGAEQLTGSEQLALPPDRHATRFVFQNDAFRSQLVSDSVSISKSTFVTR